MASVTRTAQFAKVSKVLRKHYQPVKPDFQRPVLEHLLLGCCLENAHYEAADEAFAALVHTFFDWNEIRVSTIRELGEVLAGLPDPRAAAHRVKRVLQGVFEASYSFDLEEWRKKNLGPTVKWLQSIDGTSNFSIAYVVQSALGGHSVPVDLGTLGALRVVELVTDEDVTAGVVPGLERAISKANGIEFGTMLHQLGADFTANPYSPSLRKILLQINSDVKDRLPKRRTEKKPPVKPPPAEAGGQEKTAEDRKKPARRKKAAAEPGNPASAEKKKPAAAEKESSSQEKAAAETPSESEPFGSPAHGLSKRKPR